MNRFFIFLVSMFNILSSNELYAQQQQLAFGNNTSNIFINTQYLEPNGDKVSAATVSDSFGNQYLLVFKTNKSSQIIWSYYDAFHHSCQAVRIKKGISGDYFVLASVGENMLYCIKADGTLRWARSIDFSSEYGHRLTGITELPSGNIVICGYNGFEYSITADTKTQGFLWFFDSTGNFLQCKDYGQAKTLVGDNYYFRDVEYLNGKLYVVGGFGLGSTTVTNGLFMVMKTNGDTIATRIMPRDLTVGIDTIRYNNLLDISVNKGSLFINGQSGSLQIVGRIDTSAYLLTGYALSSKGYNRLVNPIFYAKDTNEFYTAFTPSKTYSNNYIFVSKIKAGIVEYCKKIQLDTAFVARKIYERGDTVHIAGGFNNTRKAYSSYFVLADTNKACGKSDTVVSLNKISATLQSPVKAPTSNIRYPIMYSYVTWNDYCVYTAFICGDTISCPSTFDASLDTLSTSAICLGDTVKLFAGGCYPKTWYRNGVPLVGSGNFRNVTELGIYNVTISNNICIDTSISITVSKKFTPTILVSGDTLFSSRGVSYQWLDSSLNPIIAANAEYFIPTFSGKYYVIVTDSTGCKQISDAVYFYLTLSALTNNKNLADVFDVFPNPTSTYISIKTIQPSKFLIRDIKGQIVFQGTQKEVLQQYKISELNLQPGFYWVQLVQSEHCFIKKIIVN